MRRAAVVVLVLALVAQLLYVGGRMRQAGQAPDMPGPGPPPSPRPEPQPRRAPSEVPMVMPIESQPWPEVVATLGRLPPAGRLTAAQREALRPVLALLDSLARDPRTRPGVMLAAARHVLRPDQMAWLSEHARDRAPPEPPGASPEAVLLDVLRRRAAEPDEPRPTGGGGPANHPSMAFEDLVRGLPRMDRVPGLALTPHQARALLKPVALMVDSRHRLEEAKRRLLALLTPAQRESMATLHQEVMGTSAEEVSPLGVLEHR